VTKLFFLLFFGGFVYSVAGTAYIEVYRNGAFPLPECAPFLAFTAALSAMLLRETDAYGLVGGSVPVRKKLFLYWALWSTAFGIALSEREVLSYGVTLAIALGIVLTALLAIDLYKERASQIKGL